MPSLGSVLTMIITSSAEFFNLSVSGPPGASNDFNLFKKKTIWIGGAAAGDSQANANTEGNKSESVTDVDYEEVK